MHTVISISAVTASLVISLTCGIVVWLRRKEVDDRSRLFLSHMVVFSPYPRSVYLCLLGRLSWFEVYERLKPVPVGQAKQADTLWAQICQVVDGWEAWRNPNTTVNTESFVRQSYVYRIILCSYTCACA